MGLISSQSKKNTDMKLIYSYVGELSCWNNTERANKWDKTLCQKQTILIMFYEPDVNIEKNLEFTCDWQNDT